MAKEEPGRLRQTTRPRSRSEATPRATTAPETQDSESALRLADTLTLLRRMAGRPAAEVLARITDGDMLRLFPLCAQRIRDTFYILDPERVFERALAEVAVGIEIEGERSAEPAWLLERVDRAIQSVLERDRHEEHAGIPPEQPLKHYPLFIQSCFVEPALARLASVRYNALDGRVRQGFQKLIVEAMPLELVLEMGLGPPDRLQLDILHALQAIGLLDDEGVEELRAKERQP